MFSDANSADYKFNSKLDFAFSEESRNFDYEKGFLIATRSGNNMTLEEEYQKL